MAGTVGGGRARTKRLPAQSVAAGCRARPGPHRTAIPRGGEGAGGRGGALILWLRPMPVWRCTTQGAQPVFTPGRPGLTAAAPSWRCPLPPGSPGGPDPVPRLLLLLHVPPRPPHPPRAAPPLGAPPPP